ncbi:hypothetical protein RJ55_01988 [Drechmeria coniospora]|nr:hypothetical protein RJ55_01988 [Drechmeria coniospora]
MILCVLRVSGHSKRRNEYTSIRVYGSRRRQQASFFGGVKCVGHQGTTKSRSRSRQGSVLVHAPFACELI